MNFIIYTDADGTSSDFFLPKNAKLNIIPHDYKLMWHEATCVLTL